MTRRAAIHMPDITKDHATRRYVEPACGAVGYYPMDVTWAPNEVTCRRSRCQEVARQARQLYGLSVAQLNDRQRRILRRLLAADRT